MHEQADGGFVNRVLLDPVDSAPQCHPSSLTVGDNVVLHKAVLAIHRDAIKDVAIKHSGSGEHGFRLIGYRLLPLQRSPR